MTEYNLTAEELLVVQLLFEASSEENHPEFLIKFYSGLHTTPLLDIIHSLQDKHVITKKYDPKKGENFDPEAVVMNDNFLNKYRKYSGELGMEFYNEYPSIALINGQIFDLKNWAKKFQQEEDFHYAYSKAIGHKTSKHEEVIELLKWGRENNCNLLNRNIAEFVISKGWERIKEFRDNPENEKMLSFDSLVEG